MDRLTKVKCRLHTGGKTVDQIRERYTGQDLTYRNFESLQRAFDMFDGQEINLYRKEHGGTITYRIETEMLDGQEIKMFKKEHDGTITYYVTEWPKANGKIRDGVYEAEQTHPQPVYKGEREKFLADWLSGRYNARMAFEFQSEDVEELEVVPEAREPDRTPPALPRWRQIRDKKKRRRKGMRKP